MKTIALTVVGLGLVFGTFAKDCGTNGEPFVRKLTPVMGWSSWNSFGGDINYDKVKAQMDALVSLGLRDLGWTYVNIDDCFQYGRDEKTGRLRVNEKKFPGGHKAMRELVDYAHSLGLKAGIYSDGGDHCCSSGGGKSPFGRDVGFWRHEVDDANMYLADGVYRDTYAKAHPEDPGLECWGFDFIKIDWCGGGHARLNDRDQYNKIMDAIDDVERRMGKQKIVNICRWNYCGPWQFRADSWRSGPDIAQRGDSWESVMVQVDIMKEVWQYTRPGSMNDPDMLVAGLLLKPEEDKSHFAMWCMFSSPLLIGQDLTKIKPETLALYKNTELIALNQDPAVLSAGYLGDLVPGVEIWVKMLGSDRSMTRAVALLNRNAKACAVTFPYETAGYPGKVKARDLFAHKDLPPSTCRTVTLLPHGIDVLKLEPADVQRVIGPRFAAACGRTAHAGEVEATRRIDWVNAFEAVRNGAVLLDVRSPEEFAAGHVEGAVNVPHTRLGTEIAAVVPDTNTPVVCYCKQYKRAAQAAMMLDTLHYRDVLFAGDGYEASKAAPRVSPADVTTTVAEVKGDGKGKPFWASPWRSPWPLAKGKPNQAWSDKPLTVGGKVYPTGVGTEAAVRGGGTLIQCAVPKGATHFVAKVAIDDASPDKEESVRCTIHVDDLFAAESRPLTSGATHLFAVPVAGAKVIKLFTIGERPAHVDWLGAGFVVKP